MAKVMEIRMGLGYLNDFSWLASIPEAAVLSIGFDTMMRGAETLTILDRPIATACQRYNVISMCADRGFALSQTLDAESIALKDHCAPALMRAPVTAARWTRAWIEAPGV